MSPKDPTPTKSSLKRRAKQLAAFVSSLRKKRSPSKPVGPKAEDTSAPRHVSTSARPPVQRRSVVRKPAKGPGGVRRAAPSTPAAPKRAAPTASASRASVVRKPSRGPTIAKHKTSARKERRVKTRTPLSRTAIQSARSGGAPSNWQPGSSWEAQRGAPGPAFAGAGAGSQPSTFSSQSEAQYVIPTNYGDDKIILMVKDPWWLYAYWEIRPETERAARGQLLPQEIAGLRSIIRVYDVTGVDFPSQPAIQSFDISLSGMATNWFIQTDAPNHEFIVDIGLLTHTGRFLMLARSNRVRAPRFGPSEIIDENWRVTDDAFWQLLGTSGFGPGSSLSSWSSSWSSVNLVGSARPTGVKGFWCRVNTDLVIHGATEPRSSVMIQGQPALVRRDGSFSLRIALPAGSQTITIDVTSPDGRHTKTITPVVTLSWSGSLSTDATGIEMPSTGLIGEGGSA